MILDAGGEEGRRQENCREHPRNLYEQKMCPWVVVQHSISVCDMTCHAVLHHAVRAECCPAPKPTHHPILNHHHSICNNSLHNHGCGQLGTCLLTVQRCESLPCQCLLKRTRTNQLLRQLLWGCGPPAQ